VRRIALLAAAALLAAGCGGDDEEDTPEQQPVAPAPAPPQTTATEEQETTTEEETGTQPESPEDQPGGAGDEEPVRSEAVFTGRGGTIRPARIAVPAYIAVVIRLSKADDGDYSVTFEGKTIGPGEDISIDGLRPNERLTGRGSDGSRLVVSATAEPGP
jgi:hypothetical protein